MLYSLAHEAVAGARRADIRLGPYPCFARESMESRETVGSSSVTVHEDAGMEGITCLVKANAVENVGKTRVAAHRIEEGQSCEWRALTAWSGHRCRCRLSRINVEFRMGYAYHLLIEPVHDVFKTFDTMPGLARARELVRLAWEDDHGSWTFHIL
jgi:hypothetical protein